MGDIYIHRINRENRITHVNDEWLAFAVENDTPELTRDAVLNNYILDYIEGLETRNVYRELFVKVRQSLSPVTVPFRCDSPKCIRVMEMDMIPLTDDDIQFNCWLIRQEEREPMPLLDPDADRSDELLTICSWCKKVQPKGSGWMEIEDAVRALGLFNEKKPPRLTHGICPSCNTKVFGSKTKA